MDYFVVACIAVVALLLGWLVTRIQRYRKQRSPWGGEGE